MTHSGYLLKMKSGRNWKRRFCSVEGDKITYAQTEGVKPLGTLTCAAWSANAPEIGKYIPHNFKIKDKETNVWYYFASDSAPSLEAWLVALRSSGVPEEKVSAAPEPAVVAHASNRTESTITATVAVPESAAASHREHHAAPQQQPQQTAEEIAHEKKEALTKGEIDREDDDSDTDDDDDDDDNASDNDSDVSPSPSPAPAPATAPAPAAAAPTVAAPTVAAPTVAAPAAAAPAPVDSDIVQLPSIVSPTPHQPDVEPTSTISINLRGYLAFLAMKSWVRRWCSFDGVTLVCFLGPNSEERLGEFKVTNVLPAMSDLGQFEPFSFKISHVESDQFVYFAARNEVDCKKWTAALTAGAERVRSSSRTAESDARPKSDNATPVSTAAAPAPAAAAPVAAPAAQPAHIDQVGTPASIEQPKEADATDADEADAVPELKAPAAKKSNRVKSCMVFDLPPVADDSAADAAAAPATATAASATSPVDETQTVGDVSVNVSGYLGKMKKGKGWKRRWVSYDGEFMRYFEKQEDKNPLGVITVARVDDAAADLGGFVPNSFKIVSTVSQTVYYFAAQSPAELETWRKTIEIGLQVQAAKANPHSAAPAAVAAAAVAAPATASSPPPAAAAAASKSPAPAPLDASSSPHSPQTSNRAPAPAAPAPVAAAAPAGPAGVFKGFLMKKKEGKDWKKRWITLDGKTISWWKAENAKEPQGSCTVSSVTADAKELGSQIKFNFKVVASDNPKAFFFYAATQEEASRWISALSRACA